MCSRARDLLRSKLYTDRLVGDSDEGRRNDKLGCLNVPHSRECTTSCALQIESSSRHDSVRLRVGFLPSRTIDRTFDNTQQLVDEVPALK